MAGKDIGAMSMFARTDLQVSESTADSRWDAFVAGVEDGHHVQTSLWAQVKEVLGWKAMRLILADHDNILAGAQVLVKRYPLLGTVGYVTKGPVCCGEDRDLARDIIEQLVQNCRSRHVALLAVQPPNDAHYMTSILSAQGLRRSTLDLAPTASLLVDLSLDEEALLAQAKRQTRQNIRRSSRGGITIREGNEADLQTFYGLHVMSSRRQQFRPYPEAYFDTMWRVFKPRGCIQLLLADHQNEAVSAILLVPFRDTVVAKLVGWSGLCRDLRPNEALFWGSILWSKNHGYRYFDFEGINLAGARKVLQGEPLPEALQHSPDFLKYGFGGKVVLYPESYDMVFNPMLCWAYSRLPLRVGESTILSKMVDFFRKR
jgi:peptidoglycan pentaglycine glycine transferase (the first glycine)